jgi:outer membrane immunogenic protein
MRELAIKAIAATSMSLVLAAAASAADMPRTAAPPVAPPPVVYNWSGLYFGGHAGGAWAHTSWSTDFNCAVGRLCEDISQNPNGSIGGIQGGYRWQFGSWVVGVEGTYAWTTNVRSTDPSPCTPGINTCIGIPGGFNVSEETQLRNLGTVTGQAGYAWDRLLWYGKGGWAGGEIRRNTADTLGPAAAATFFDTVTQRANGWTVGTGLEYMFWQNFSFGIEYDYVHLNASDFAVFAHSGTGTLAFLNNASGVSANAHQVVARLNWKLFNFR